VKEKSKADVSSAVVGQIDENVGDSGFLEGSDGGSGVVLELVEVSLKRTDEDLRICQFDWTETWMKR